MSTKSFEQFAWESAQQGHTNVIFEHGMYSLFEDLERLLAIFAESRAPFEFIGGVAVNAHLMAAAKRSRSFVTRDIDVLIRRNDLNRVVEAAEKSGYECKRMIGEFALIAPGQELSEAVHLLFVGEKTKSSYPAVNPELNPESMQLFGLTMPVAPLRDLLILKLNSLRPKDVVHLEILDEVGFITPALEEELSGALRERLAMARTQFERNT